MSCHIDSSRSISTFFHAFLFFNPFSLLGHLMKLWRFLLWVTAFFSATTVGQLILLRFMEQRGGDSRYSHWEHTKKDWAGTRKLTSVLVWMFMKQIIRLICRINTQSTMKNNSWHHERQRCFSKQEESIHCVLQFNNYTDYLDSKHLLEVIHERVTYFLLLVNIRWNDFPQILEIRRWLEPLRKRVTVGE